MKRILPFVIVGLVAVATLTAGAILYRAKRPHLLTIPQDKMVAGKVDTALMHIRGDPKAQVTLEEFGDFQCPPCANISAFLDDVVKDYNPRVRLIFRNFPLPSHKYAEDSALAAEAAGLQGRFWDMHDLLYREQNVWSKADNVPQLLHAYAGILGLNLDQFKKDMASEKTKERIKTDRERATSLGIKSTPTLFVNNHEMGPADRTPEGVRKMVDDALKGKGPGAAQGTPSAIPAGSPSPAGSATPTNSPAPAARPAPAVSPTPIVTATPTATAKPTPRKKTRRHK